MQPTLFWFWRRSVLVLLSALCMHALLASSLPAIILLFPLFSPHILVDSLVPQCSQYGVLIEVKGFALIHCSQKPMEGGRARGSHVIITCWPI